MKVTFIEHSGFMVEMEQNVLLFDYYQGEIPSFDGSKTLYVFASHSHADHYNSAIWKLKEQYRDIHYILSDDIKDNEGAVVMKAHEKKEVAGIEIETLRSNDMGVAFLVKVEGKTIYHAGDLNWWHWNGEPEEDPLGHRGLEPPETVCRSLPPAGFRQRSLPSFPLSADFLPQPDLFSHFRHREPECFPCPPEVLRLRYRSFPCRIPARVFLSNP